MVPLKAIGSAKLMVEEMDDGMEMMKVHLSAKLMVEEMDDGMELMRVNLLDRE